MRIFYDVGLREIVRRVLARGETVRRGEVEVVDYEDGLMELKGVYRREASMCCCRRALEDSLASKVHGPWYSFLTGAGVDHQARTRIKRTWPL